MDVNSGPTPGSLAVNVAQGIEDLRETAAIHLFVTVGF